MTIKPNFSQIKDIKHIKRNFHSVTWVMPQGWNLGVLWFSEYGHVAYQIKQDA